MNSIQFSKLAIQDLMFNDNCRYLTHNNLSLAEQILFQIIAGYSVDSSANLLKEDPIFHLALGKETIASQVSLSRFWDWISETTIDKVRLNRNSTDLINDLDSTHSDKFGHQEEPVIIL